MPIVLVIKHNEDVHSVLLTMKPIIIGRSSSSDIRVADDQVSGRHLALKASANGKVLIKDLDSTNGTYLNGALVKESYLMLEDQLTLGDIELSLDESQMTHRERKNLTREEAPTQVKYIKLSNSSDAPQESQKKPEHKPRPTPTVVFQDSELQDVAKEADDKHSITTTVTQKDELPRVFNEHKKVIEEQSRPKEEKREKKEAQVKEKEAPPKKAAEKRDQPSKAASESEQVKKKSSRKPQSQKKKKNIFQEIVGIFRKD